MFRVATPWLGLPELLNRIVIGASAVLMAVAAMWGGSKLIDTLGDHSLRRAERSAGTLDEILVSLVLVACKMLLLAGGFVFIASQLSLPYDSVLAGLGIGGLAVAFASKETLSNVFGAAILVADRPFRRGDWISSGDVQGTVEHVGVRSTRIRTAGDSLAVVPNGKLADATVNNLGVRRTKAVNVSLLLSYATDAATLEAFMAGLAAVVERVPATVPGSAKIGVSGLEADGIGVNLGCALDVPTAAEERECRNALMLGVLRLAERLGVRLGDRTTALAKPAAMAHAE